MTPRSNRYAYGTSADQFGILTRPDTNSSVPVIVVIHGGYWKDNHDLHSYATNALAEHLAQQYEVAVWNLEYRRMNADGTNLSAPWPNCMADVGRGIDFLRKISEHEGLDLARLMITGHSAGGHLAAWAGCRPSLPENSPLRVEDPLIPSHLVPICGVLNLREFGILSQPDQVRRLIGGLPDELPERYADASPCEMRLPDDISLTIIHGEDDLDVPKQMSIDFQVSQGHLKSACIMIRNADHFGMLPVEGVYPKGWHELTKLFEQFVGELENS